MPDPQKRDKVSADHVCNAGALCNAEVRHSCTLFPTDNAKPREDPFNIRSECEEDQKIQRTMRKNGTVRYMYNPEKYLLHDFR